MRTIWKFPFNIADEQTLRIPARAKIIHVGEDPTGRPCIWAEVDSSDRLVDWTIFVIPTGGVVFPKVGKHIGSFVSSPFVWHVYVA